MCKAILDVRALMLVRNQNTVVGRRNDHVLRPHDDHRHAKHIDGVAVLTGIVPCHIPDAVLLHLLRERIPCAKILPDIIITNRRDAFPVL